MNKSIISTILASVLSVACGSGFSVENGDQSNNGGSNSSGGAVMSGGSVGAGGSLGETGGSVSTGGGMSNGGTGGQSIEDRDPNCEKTTCEEITFELTGTIPPEENKEGQACGAHEDPVCGGNVICETSCNCGGERNKQMRDIFDSAIQEPVSGVCGADSCLEQKLVTIAIEFCEATLNNGQLDIKAYTCTDLTNPPANWIKGTSNYNGDFIYCVPAN